MAPKTQALAAKPDGQLSSNLRSTGWKDRIYQVVLTFRGAGTGTPMSKFTNMHKKQYTKLQKTSTEHNERQLMEWGKISAESYKS